MHSQRKVVGSLGQDADCAFAVDANDNAVLYNKFGKFFKNERLEEGKVPPEYRHSYPVGASIKAVPQTDIFQLGLQLWQVAAKSKWRSPLKILQECWLHHKDRRDLQ